ncbi:MAG: hypothetical protein ACREV6_06085 [Clostridium sp.]|uniref:hypothetical protein n=1 Tax=Clostridium sp. TaxID=1506 RepID=UPI003D6CABA1
MKKFLIPIIAFILLFIGCKNANNNVQNIKNEAVTTIHDANKNTKNDSKTEEKVFYTEDSIIKFKDKEIEQSIKQALNITDNNYKLTFKDLLSITKRLGESFRVETTNENWFEDFDKILLCKNADDLQLITPSFDKVDLTKLKELTKLRVLFLTKKNSTGSINTNFLPKMKNLKYLTLNNFNLNNANYEDLKNLNNLQSLSFIKCKNISIEKISELKSLRLLAFDTIDLSKNNLSPLSKLEKLDFLCLVDCNLQDFNVPVNTIRYLQLDNNKIKKIDLSNYANLNTLQAKNNEISTILAPKKNNVIYFIDLPDNKLTDINFIKNLDGLIDLRVKGNDIKDLSPLKNRKNIDFRN